MLIITGVLILVEISFSFAFLSTNHVNQDTFLGCLQGAKAEINNNHGIVVLVSRHQNVRRLHFRESFGRIPVYLLRIDHTLTADKICPLGTEQFQMIAFNNLEEIQEVCDILSSCEMITRWKFWLIYLQPGWMDSVKIAQEALTMLYRYSVRYAVVLVPSKTPEIFHLYKLVYFANDSCDYLVDPLIEKVDQCEDGQYKNTAIWYDPIPRKFKSCEVKVAYLNIPPFAISKKIDPKGTKVCGMEVNLLYKLFALWNVTLKFVQARHLGEVLTNKTVTGSLRLLELNKAQIAIGGYSQTELRCTHFDCSVPYHFESLSYAVPHEHILPTGIVSNISNFMHITAFMVIVVFIGIMTILINYISRYTEERQKYRSCINTFLELFSIVVANSTITSLPKVISVRILFGGLLIFGIIFNAAFTTHYTTMLINLPAYYEKYSNLNDVLQHNLTVHMTPNSERFFQNKNSLNYLLVQKSTVCQVTDNHRCLKDVAFHRNACYLAQRSFLQFSSMSYLAPSQYRLIKVLEPLVSYPINFVLKKNFWGYKKLDRLLLQAHQSGLTKRWLSIPRNDFTIIYIGKVHPEQSAQLQYANFFFQIFMIGYSISGVVWVLEIVLFKYGSNIHLK